MNKGKPTRSRECETSHGNVRLAAIDLGTNNCRMLIAAPGESGLRIVDSISRIVRLGEGLSKSGVLCDAAMARTIDAIKICADKISHHGVTHLRCVSTQACRAASNGPEFLDRIQRQTGLTFEIISPQEEARLGAAACGSLQCLESKASLVFDIGGGSTELSWLVRDDNNNLTLANWASLPMGVVSLSEKWGGRDLDQETYDGIVAEAREKISAIGDPKSLKPLFENDLAHLMGTSGTITSIAGVFLDLTRYRRDRVDGLWLSADDVRKTAGRLREMSFAERQAQPCIGTERADLVVAGCAIVEALIQVWPADRVRVADRGLREGILSDLAREAGCSA